MSPIQLHLRSSTFVRVTNCYKQLPKLFNNHQMCNAVSTFTKKNVMLLSVSRVNDATVATAALCAMLSRRNLAPSSGSMHLYRETAATDRISYFLCENLHPNAVPTSCQPYFTPQRRRPPMSTRYGQSNALLMKRIY